MGLKGCFCLLLLPLSLSLSPSLSLSLLFLFLVVVVVIVEPAPLFCFVFICLLFTVDLFRTCLLLRALRYPIYHCGSVPLRLSLVVSQADCWQQNNKSVK